jgi:DNA-binding transcriptional ArsR family regulator
MMPPALTQAEAEAAAARLRLFAQPQRLMILACLLDGERSVGEIEAASGIGQPALSQQLADLRKGEAVAARRQSRQVYYRLSGEDVEHCVRSLCAMFGSAGKAAGAAPARAEAGCAAAVPQPWSKAALGPAARFATIGASRP